MQYLEIVWGTLAMFIILRDLTSNLWTGEQAKWSECMGEWKGRKLRWCCYKFNQNSWFSILDRKGFTEEHKISRSWPRWESQADSSSAARRAIRIQTWNQFKDWWDWETGITDLQPWRRDWSIEKRFVKIEVQMRWLRQRSPRIRGRDQEAAWWCCCGGRKSHYHFGPGNTSTTRWEACFYEWVELFMLMIRSSFTKQLQHQTTYYKRWLSKILASRCCQQLLQAILPNNGNPLCDFCSYRIQIAPSNSDHGC